MDWMTFTSRLVDGLAWQGMVFVFALIFRKALVNIFPSVQRLKNKDFELEIGEKIGKVRTELAAGLPSQFRESLPSAETQPIFRLSEISPRAAVLEAWRAVEAATLDLARKNAHSGGKSLLFRKVYPSWL